jgi:hypothetical protein
MIKYRMMVITRRERRLMWMWVEYYNLLLERRWMNRRKKANMTCTRLRYNMKPASPWSHASRLSMIGRACKLWSWDLPSQLVEFDRVIFWAPGWWSSPASLSPLSFPPGCCVHGLWARAGVVSWRCLLRLAKTNGRILLQLSMGTLAKLWREIKLSVVGCKFMSL